MTDRRSLLRALEEGRLPSEDALAALAAAAHDAPTSVARIDACRGLGSLAGRAFGASWDVAERAAFALLDVARETDAPRERAGLLLAMGRAFRNAWLVPYVHARLADDDEEVVAAAVAAAGGLAFPALEAYVAAFLSDGTPRPIRLAAVASLGRMGAGSAAKQLVPLIDGPALEAAAALSALTEMRSREGEGAALARMQADPPREVLLAAVRYLAEMGCEVIATTLPALARHEDAELRVCAGLASYALESARRSRADERILAALTERDRAVRASLARRLRTLPIGDVLEQAELLLPDDPEGVIQVVAEVRAPEVTRMLVRLATDERLGVAVRARAAGSIEADETWEREALVSLALTAGDVPVRVAAAQTIGAFAAPGYVLEHLEPLAAEQEPALRSALLWAMQLAAGPVGFAAPERARVEGILRAAIRDADPVVRRRAAYVAGNVHAESLVPDLVELVRREESRADLRLAAFVGLAEIGSEERLVDLVALWIRESDPEVLRAASFAVERAVGLDASRRDDAGAPRKSTPAAALSTAFARLHERLRKLVASKDAKMRTAATRLAGLLPEAVPVETIVALAEDESPRVREQAVTALGRIAGADCAPALVGALDDADTAIGERAALGLLALGSVDATTRVIDFVSRSPDEAMALRTASRIVLPSGDASSLAGALDGALDRAGPDHPIYESLLSLKLRALEMARPSFAPGPSVDGAITEHFPTWPRLSAVRGFAALAKSLRTAEMLYSSTAAGVDADCAAPIVLWMKSLEGYLHAWLAPRLASMQARPGDLWELTDRLSAVVWPPYHRWLDERWADPVDVGALRVEVPLRAAVHALRSLSERQGRSPDSPKSVTEWSRLMLFFAVDHPSGARNVLQVGSADAERTVRLAHRLQVLAQVRNSVTHRSVASASTLEVFRRAYYTAFEDLTGVA
ncbi:MAG: HEAT repeat domain-containing protein [Deltaproteobacteria bacterium]|nr:HEAT repeat domain-containing protein [Deltaproteobacteria bacterium]